MRIVPIQSTPAQQVTVTLGNQVCQITVRQNRFGVFLDLAVNNSSIISGVICQINNRVVRDKYLGFDGDLIFIDTQGDANGVSADVPNYTGFGTRFLLAYLELTDYPEGYVDG